jgi:4-aminobutyrate aminotransferase / (S)-3-amino-2-methylpropionate transaminase / 5-aminovalerate transaminase
VLQGRLEALKAKYPEHIGAIRGKGLVAGMICVEPGSSPEKPDGAFAHDVVWRCVERGLLMFAPVGYMGSTVKICPPLTITEEALSEGCDVLDEVVAEVAALRGAAVQRS